MHIDVEGLVLVLEQQRQEIMRALRARQYRLSPGQAIEIVPGTGLEVVVRVVTVAEPKVLIGKLPAREFFTASAFDRVVGKHPLTTRVIERIHRLVNGHGWTVEEFLAHPSVTVVALVARDWQPKHLELFKSFLQRYDLRLREE